MLYNNLNFEAVKFASSSDLRPELSGVFFKADKVVATDRFRLVEITTDKTADIKEMGKEFMQGFKPFIIGAKQVKEMAKIVPNYKRLPQFNYAGISFADDKFVEFISHNLETNLTEKRRASKINGTFPDYEKLFETGNAIAEIEINGNYMAGILETLAKFNFDYKVKIKFYGENKPLIFEAGNASQKARAALMPFKNI